MDGATSTLDGLKGVEAVLVVVALVGERGRGAALGALSGTEAVAAMGCGLERRMLRDLARGLPLVRRGIGDAAACSFSSFSSSAARARSLTSFFSKSCRRVRIEAANL